ncbi:hypothetical protein AB4Y32_03405 [Paraburkholderia phymatum]|uniref:Uncharacterized protein n=1 Tax=Paraburkholderia phymatum TaxID=148447 RepID=A0ACC6TUE4_9BURK
MSADQLIYSPQDFANGDFAKECAPCYDRFIELRILGIPRDLAIVDAFDMIAQGASLKNAEQLGLAAELNPYVKARFDAALEAKKPTQLWTANKSISRLLRLIENPNSKGSDKMAAIKELNVLCGITVIDEQGRSRVPNLNDLYASMLGATPEGPSPAPLQ